MQNCLDFRVYFTYFSQIHALFCRFLLQQTKGIKTNFDLNFQREGVNNLLNNLKKKTALVGSGIQYGPIFKIRILYCDDMTKSIYCTILPCCHASHFTLWISSSEMAIVSRHLNYEIMEIHLCCQKHPVSGIVSFK